MKILNALQVREAEEWSREKQGLPEYELMERASLAIFEYIHERLQGRPLPIYVCCGIGNNGGDGLALVRHLSDHGYVVSAYLVNYGARRSEGFLHQLELLKTRKLYPQYIHQTEDIPVFEPDGLIVDSLFGIGLNRDPGELVRAVIRAINEAPCFVLSVDMPSGLFMDRVPPEPKAVIQADTVLTFQAPKLVFFLPDTFDFVRNWQVIDIGLDRDYIEGLPAEFDLVGPGELLPWYRERHPFAHKGTFGHVLLAGGSKGSMGALILAAEACMKAGAGKATALAPACGLVPLQIAVPEVMVRVDPGESHLQSLELPMKPGSYSVLVMGMGMGTREETLLTLKEFLRLHTGPLVLDADALNLLGKNPRLLKNLPAHAVLLPHPRELKGLIGDWKDDFDKLAKARRFVEKYRCILVIKGAYSMILHQGGTFINQTGNPGMATAGSGDVLAGVVGGLIAQGYPPLQGATLGVMLHGLAGDIAADQMGMEAVTARELIAQLGHAFLTYSRPPAYGERPAED